MYKNCNKKLKYHKLTPTGRDYVAVVPYKATLCIYYLATVALVQDADNYYFDY